MDDLTVPLLAPGGGGGDLPERFSLEGFEARMVTDEVAYLRFASVYQAFENLDDFEEAIALLRREDAARAAES